MFPTIANVVDVVDAGLAPVEHVAQAHLSCLDARLGPPVVVHQQAKPLPTDGEHPKVAIEPSHDGLDNIVQDLERDRGRHLDLTPDQGIGVPQLDANRGDLVEAVGCRVLPNRAHSASLAGSVIQF
jgi:hypothetical protein